MQVEATDAPEPVLDRVDVRKERRALRAKELVERFASDLTAQERETP